MAESDGKIVVEIVLDDGSIQRGFINMEKKAKETSEKSSGHLSKIGESAVEGLNKINPALGNLASSIGSALTNPFVLAGIALTSVIALKSKLFDMALEGEEIKRIETSFDSMAARMGQNSSQLKEAFIQAAGGASDLEEILKASTVALAELGSEGYKLPQLFAMAQAAADKFGGTALENYEKLNQAILSGNTRMLRSIQVFVDSGQVLDAYARSIGKAASELTQHEKQQGLLNAVLEKGKILTGENAGAADTLKNANLALGVSIKDLFEAIAVGVSQSKLGDYFKSSKKEMASFVDDISSEIKQLTGTEPAEEAVKRLTNDWVALTAEMEKSRSEGAGEFTLKMFQARISDVTAELSTYSDLVERSQKELLGKMVTGAAETKAAAKEAIPIPTPEELATRAAAYNAALAQYGSQALQLRTAAAQAMAEGTAKTSELEAIDNERKLQAANDHYAKMLQIEKDFSDKKGFSVIERNAILEAEDRRFVGAIQQIEADSSKKRLAFSTQTGQSLKNIMVQGLTNAFVSVGESLQAGKGLFDDFGANLVAILGDMSISLGSALIAQGLALEYFITAVNAMTPGAGFAAAAAGAGLVIFGAAIKASVGKGGGSAVSSSGGGIASSDSTGDKKTDQLPETLQPQKQEQVVNINVTGSILNTSESARQLADLISDAFDKEGVTIRQGAFAS